MYKSLESFRALPFFKTPVLPYIRRFDLHGVVANAGHEFLSGPGYAFHGLERGEKPLAVFQLTLKGTGALRYGDREYRMTPGDCMLVAIPHDHRYYFPEDAPYWEFVYICVSGSEFMRLITGLLADGDPIFPVKDYPVIIPSLKEILTHVSLNKISDEFLLSGCAYRMFMQMISIKYGPGKKNDPENVNENVAFALQYCSIHMHEPFSVEDIADQLGIHRSHLSREFKKYRGISLKEHLENLRMEKAVRLLLSGQLPISRVGLKCGYDDFNYFCRVFRKRFNQSPGQYRKSYQYLYD